MHYTYNYTKNLTLSYDANIYDGKFATNSGCAEHTNALIETRITLINHRLSLILFATLHAIVKPWVNDR